MKRIIVICYKNNHNNISNNKPMKISVKGFAGNQTR